LIPAKHVRPYAKGQKNDFNDAEAIAEAAQRPTMKFVAPRLRNNSTSGAPSCARTVVSQRTDIINQIRGFMLERGIAVRQGIRFLRAQLPAPPADSRPPSGIRMAVKLRGGPGTSEALYRPRCPICKTGTPHMQKSD